MYYDSFWVRSALSQLESLASGRVVDADTRRMIEFAIRWAPFGGSDDLLVTFGVDRRRFVALLEEGLGTGRADNSDQRWVKRRLWDALSSAWCVDSTPTTGAPPC
ncbi:hypothetical protein AB0M12_38075 [Nocardia vinacea]|uniref:hypothetical protein n=1 Tax=Nocardia vinacea TaxID=96468 RepID=UPI0034311486